MVRPQQQEKTTLRKRYVSDELFFCFTVWIMFLILDSCLSFLWPVSCLSCNYGIRFSFLELHSNSQRKPRTTKGVSFSKHHWSVTTSDLIKFHWNRIKEDLELPFQAQKSGDKNTFRITFSSSSEDWFTLIMGWF